MTVLVSFHCQDLSATEIDFMVVQNARWATVISLTARASEVNIQLKVIIRHYPL